MRKLGVVVILMKKNKNDIEYLFNERFDEIKFNKIPSLEPFSEDAINFLDTLSKKLLKNFKTKAYPDVATFAFFCRRGNIIKLKQKYNDSSELRLGVGTAFHIAPSNVPVNFAYSLICGVLSGNKNIVRVPSITFDQVEIIVEAIADVCLIKDFQYFNQSIVIIRYDYTSNYTEHFSSISDIRIIWGGDETINNVRKSQIGTRAFDITFADRYSICLINSNVYLEDKKYDQIAEDFYNDTYLFDQNACTAPHLIIWVGSKKNIKKSKKIFWETLHKVVINKYEVQPVIAVDKLTSLYNQLIHMEGLTLEDSKDNLILKIRLKNLEKDIEKYRCTSGYFNEYDSKSLDEINKIINRKYQTLSYYGIDKKKLEKFIIDNKPSGIDRIVPIGKTTDFSLTWDGYDLIRSLSRKIEII